jgi:hypothetical protein
MNNPPTKTLNICSECIDSKLLTLCDGTQCCYHNFFELEQNLRLSIRKKCNKDRVLHYEVTITTTSEENAVDAVTKLDRFLKSKQFKPTRSWTACVEHEKTNAHIHLYVETDMYINIKDLYRMMKSRVSVQRLKTPMDRIKWKQYVVKAEADKTVFDTLDDIHEYLNPVKSIDLSFE